MSKITIFFLTLLLACTSSPRNTLSLSPATTDLQGAPGALIIDPSTQASLSATTRDLIARLDVEKPNPDAHFFRLELLILGADRQPLATLPALNVSPNDLDKLNSKRSGKFTLRFRADVPTKESTTIGENRAARRSRDKTSNWPAFLADARYFLLRAEIAQTGKSTTTVPEPEQAPSTVSAPKTIPEIVAKAEPAVFFVYCFDAAGNGLKQGSGFFIDPSGIGVSNHHVFDGGVQWAIQTTDKRQYRVSEVLKSSREYDYVVFRVEASAPFPFLNIATEKALKGEEILVIGNPRGLESTVTQGIVSALRDPMIQIDAAVSPGNSGGPVLNRRGEVLGIATQKVPDCENCNFAFDIRVLDIDK